VQYSPIGKKNEVKVVCQENLFGFFARNLMSSQKP